MPWLKSFPKTPTCFTSSDSFQNFLDISSPPLKRNRTSVLFDSPPPSDFMNSSALSCLQQLNETLELSINCSVDLLTDDTITEIADLQKVSSIFV